MKISKFATNHLENAITLLLKNKALGVPTVTRYAHESCLLQWPDGAVTVITTNLRP